jgi:hypothetical protein
MSATEDRKKLVELKNKLNYAGEKLREELERQWPAGSKVSVRLCNRQIFMTGGIVTSHRDDGHIIVKIDSAKENSRRPYRHVYFTDMISLR